VWVDFFRGADTRVNRTLRRLIDDEEDLCLTSLNLTEILQGITRDAVYEETRRHLIEFPIFEPEGLSTYLHAADIYRTCRRRGKTIRSTIDCLIAAIAIEHDLVLLHNDRDFAHIATCAPLAVLG
jgi:predicted nucleic acid-binding protein